MCPRILWANPAGFAALHAADRPRPVRAHFRLYSVAAQISAPGLNAPLQFAANGLSGRVEWATESGQTLTCFCSRVSVPDLGPAVLVVAAEAAGPSLSEQQRLQKLLVGFTTPVAAFSPDGSPAAGDAERRESFDGATSLDELSAMALDEEALRKGSACGATKAGSAVSRSHRRRETIALCC